MESYNRFTKCMFDWLRRMFQLVGHDVMVGSLKRNAMSYLVYASTVLLLVSEAYTLMYYDDMFTQVFCLHISLFTIQSLAKLYSIQYVDDMQWVAAFIQDIYKAHIDSPSPERIEYFRKFSLFTEYLFKIILIMYSGTVSVCFMYPFYVYYAQNEIIPIMPLYIPGIDERTTIGFAILSIYHVFMICLATIGITATDYFLAVIIISALMFSKIISLEMQRIHHDLDEENSMLDVKCRFRNILRMHNELCEYMSCVDSLTFTTYFAQIGASTYGAIVLLYVVLVMKFLPAYFLVFGLIIFIFTACLLGNFIELTHDRIYEAALDLRWNELPIDEQEMYQLFIQQCQNPTLLTVGGLYSLNLDTCLMLFSRIYNTTTLFYSMFVE